MLKKKKRPWRPKAGNLLAEGVEFSASIDRRKAYAFFSSLEILEDSDTDAMKNAARLLLLAGNRLYLVAFSLLPSSRSLLLQSAVAAPKP